MPGAETKTVQTNSAEETRALGEKLAGHLGPGSVIALIGDLGSGKTTLVQGICRGLGVTGIVNSPSFTIVNEYRGRWPIYHLDCYRLEGEQDLLGLGCEEYFYGDGVCLVEWAEKAADLLPVQRIEVHLTRQGMNRRKILINRVEEDAGSGSRNGYPSGLRESGG
jgi:tRNA threonylcarbamoyladenosine biosynthesis protein TsaE